MKNRTLPYLLLLSAISLGPAPAAGVTVVVSDTVDDATLTLVVEDSLTVAPPSTDWCLVEIDVLGDEVDFTAGDSLFIEVYEDDLVGDDLFFAARIGVTAAEVAAQRVVRSFDCSTDPAGILDGVGEFSEVYAKALVVKDACDGLFCRYDRPETRVVDVWIVEPASSVPANSLIRLGDAYPNPFNPRTTISFTVPPGMTVDLRVYDTSGLLVRRLATGLVGTGALQEVAWNARDDAGRRVAAGVYFYRLDAADFTATKRVTLVK